MSDSPTPQVPPGWYPDTEVPGGQRWWDGREWSEYRSGPAAVVAAPTMTIPADAWPYVGQATPGLAVPLWAPLYGAGMRSAWSRFWRKYVDFTGRASRSEFWFAYLWVVILGFGSYLLFAVLAVAVSAAASAGDGSAGAAVGIGFGVFGLIWMLGYLAMIIPLISVSVRRLHDAGYPGTYYLFGLIPFVGGILLLVYLATDSRPAGAFYDVPRP